MRTGFCGYTMVCKYVPLGGFHRAIGSRVLRFVVVAAAALLNSKALNPKTPKPLTLNPKPVGEHRAGQRVYH